MRAICPNDPTHDRFHTVAYVSEDWVVDSEGNLIEVCVGSEAQVFAWPDPDNTWTCAECGAEAKVER